MAARRDHTETLQRMHSPRGIKSTLEPIADVGALKLDKAAADPLMKAGDSQYVESGRWHGGKVPMRLLGLMIIDKDKPILEMAH